MAPTAPTVLTEPTALAVLAADPGNGYAARRPATAWSKRSRTVEATRRWAPSG
jgi:hypothetical protein